MAKRRKKSTKKSTKKKPTVSVRKVHGQNQIDFEFQNVRKIENKIDLLKEVPNTEFKKRMKPGKPPKGALIVVTLNDGRTHTVKTPVDFVVNPVNIKAFVEGIVEKMKDDYTQWLVSGKPKINRKPYGSKRRRY